MSLTTKTGDDGFTDLYLGGSSGNEPCLLRVKKDDPCIEFLGTLDELDAHLSFCEISLQTAGLNDYPEIIAKIRKALVSAMAVNAAELPSNTAWLEEKISALEKEKPIQDFVRSWKEPAPACLNIARSVCRRAERRLVTVINNSENQTNAGAIDWKPILPWLNRVSDLLFQLSG